MSLLTLLGRRVFFGSLILILFLKEFFVSSIKLMVSIYFRAHKLQSEIVDLPLSPCSSARAIAIAHFITLTPGTLSIQILANQTIRVHALHPEDVEGLKKLVYGRLEPLFTKANL